MVVALTTTTLVADLPPTVTLLAPVKLVPTMVIFVAPSAEPNVGLTLAIVGAAARYVNAPAAVAVPPEVVTATALRPNVPAGVTAVSDVSLTTTTPVAATPPTFTVVAPTIK